MRRTEYTSFVVEFESQRLREFACPGTCESTFVHTHHGAISLVREIVFPAPTIPSGDRLLS